MATNYNYHPSGGYAGYLGDAPDKKLNKFVVENDRVHEIHDVIVHKFNLGDVEDPEIYAAEPIYNWQQTEQGKWVMEHAVEAPVWHRWLEPISYSQNYAIMARLKGPDYTYYALKWGQIT